MNRIRLHLSVLMSGVAIGTGGLACSEADTLPAVSAAPSAEVVRGFVVTRWHEEIPSLENAGECEAGFNPTEEEYFPEQWADWLAERLRRRDAGGYLPWDDERLPPDACQDPLAQPDPGFLTLDGPATVHGLDLDGVASAQNDPGVSCAHDDFAGHDGATGIDNQFWRLMGCVRGYRPNDLMDRLHQAGTTITEGGYALLMEINGVDDLRNDDEVEVQLLSANHGVTVDASGDLMRDVSYTAHADARFHAPVARGRIEDGVLTTDPVDVRYKVKQQTMDNEFWLRSARFRAEIQEDGSIVGLVGGYWDVENLFSTLNEQWIGKYHQGRNAARSRGFMCAGIYHAMPRVADGHPDPETGRCTSISTALHFRALPAFVIRSSEMVAHAD